MPHGFKLPLVATAQPEGGFTITSPALPELVTEGNTLEEALDHVKDAFAAVLELYADLHKPLPAHLSLDELEHPASRLRKLRRHPVTYREAARRLRALGCHEVPRRSGGSHRKWVSPLNQRGTVLPDWGSADLRLGTLRAAVRQLGLDWDRFLAS